MKTFEQLLPGDKIYWIRTGQNALHKGNFFKKEITDLANNQEGIYLNRSYSSYHGKHYYSVTIPPDLKKESVFEDKKEQKIYFSDKELFYQTTRGMALSEIREKEKSIIDYREKTEKEIRDIRELYFEFLN